MHNKQKKKTDKSRMILSFVICVICLCICVSFIPPFRVMGIKVSRANFLEGLISFNDSSDCHMTSKDIIDTSCIADLSESVLVELDRNSCATLSGDSSTLDTTSWDVSDTIFVKHDVDTKVVGTSKEGGLVNLLPNKIEDYSPNHSMIRQLRKLCLSSSKEGNFRIAFLGDSYIEGDILTYDLRTALQKNYGGEGLGFIPFADPMSKIRPYVKQDYRDWKRYNILKRNNTPKSIKDEFFISGYVSLPKQGAYSTFTTKCKDKDKFLSRKASILFKNRGKAKMRVIVNDSVNLVYDLEESDEIQCVDVNDINIRKLTVKLDKCENFIGYGVVFEGEAGVVLDNFGLRSNSGLNLFSTHMSVNQQMNNLLKYDLIIMEYGLNAMNKEVTNYRYYSNKMEKLIDYVKMCFPESAIMLLSVGDVSIKKESQYVTAPAVPSMVQMQHDLAQKSQIMYWSIYDAMGGSNSMQDYVSKGWASKDYVHINNKGGKQISNLLMQSIRDVVQSNNN